MISETKIQVGIFDQTYLCAWPKNPGDDVLFFYFSSILVLYTYFVGGIICLVIYLSQAQKHNNTNRAPSRN